MQKHRFTQRFTERVLTRFHMALILSGTALSGVLFSKLLLLAGMTQMVVRFSLVLVLAYIVFFALMRLWLAILTSPNRKKKSAEQLSDTADMLSGGVDLADGSSGTIYGGNGGDFGGGGASGAWSALEQSAGDGIAGAAGRSGEDVGQSASGGVSDAVSGLGDEGAPVLLALALLLLVLLGGSLYLVYEAPVILSEAAFEFVLAGSLIKKAKSMDRVDWLGSVFGATWKPFALTLGIVVLAGWLADAFCPQAIKLSEVLRICVLKQ